MSCFESIFGLDESSIVRLDDDNTFLGNNIHTGINTFTNQLIFQKEAETSLLVYSEASNANLELQTSVGLFQISSRSSGTELSVFYTTDRITWTPPQIIIQSGGNVAIGGYDPLHHLHVWGTGEQVIKVESSTGISSLISMTTTSDALCELETSNAIYRLANRYSSLDFAISYSPNRSTPFSSPAFLIKSSGSVAIGGVNPLHHLHVFGSGAQVMKVESSNDTAATVSMSSTSNTSFETETVNSIFQIVGLVGTNDLAIRYAPNRATAWSSPFIVVKNTGNVSIGGDTPAQHLHVLGTGAQAILVESSTTTSTAILKAVTNANVEYESPSSIFRTVGRSGTNDFILEYSTDRVTWSSPIIVAKNTGNIAIGGDTPAQHVHVWGGGAQAILVESSSGTANLILKGTTDANVELESPSSIFRMIGRTGTNDYAIQYTTNRVSWSAPLLIVKNGGNIGIGGDNPLFHLHIYGTGEQMLKVESSTGKAGIDFTGGSTHRYQWCKEPPGALNNAFVLNYYDGATWTTPRLAVSTSGFFGINTDTPTRTLDINADTIRLRTARTIPGSTSTGIVGEWCWDTSYMYICVSTNTWRRCSLGTFAP